MNATGGNPGLLIAGSEDDSRTRFDAQRGSWEQQENKARNAEVFTVTGGCPWLGRSGSHTRPFLIVVLHCTAISWVDIGKSPFLRQNLCKCVAAWGGPYLSEHWGG